MTYLGDKEADWTPTPSWVQTDRHPAVVYGAAWVDILHLGEGITSTAFFNNLNSRTEFWHRVVFHLCLLNYEATSNRVGWTRMWMSAIVGPPPPYSQRPHIYDWLLSSLNLLCLHSLQIHYTISGFHSFLSSTCKLVKWMWVGQPVKF